MSQKSIVLNKELASFTVDYLNHFIRQHSAQYSRVLYKDDPANFALLLEYTIRARDEINKELQTKIKANILKRIWCYAFLGQEMNYGASISCKTAKVISFLTGLFIDSLQTKLTQKSYVQGENEDLVKGILCHTLNLNNFLNTQLKLHEKAALKI